MPPLYLNPRGWRVRVAQAAIWLGALIILWLCFLAAPNFNNGPADQVVIVAAPIFSAFCVGAFEIYLRHYVLAIAQADDKIIITTLASLHRRTLALDKRRLHLGGQRHEHTLPGLAPGVDNFSSRLRVTGWRWPLIIDETPPAALDRDALFKALR